MKKVEGDKTKLTRWVMRMKWMKKRPQKMRKGRMNWMMVPVNSASLGWHVANLCDFWMHLQKLMWSCLCSGEWACLHRSGALVTINKDIIKKLHVEMIWTPKWVHSVCGAHRNLWLKFVLSGYQEKVQYLHIARYQYSNNNNNIKVYSIQLDGSRILWGRKKLAVCQQSSIILVL